jgi:hypothetical protein
MENRIRRIEVYDHSLNPAAAEVWISVWPAYQTATTEVRGRLMGPRCLYSSTVEVAYALRPLPTALETLRSPRTPQSGGLTVRVVIPEANLWEPQCPFLYQGPVELWQDGQLCDRVILSHGLRSWQRKGHSVLVNGRPLKLRGRRVAACSDEEAIQWRRAGYNLLIATVVPHSLAVWEQADRFGFFVLGQLGEDAEEACLVEKLRGHASCLGWLDAECRALSAEEAIDWYVAHGNSEAV